MAHLVKLGFVNSENGLSKARCDLCGETYGSMREAQDCENSHFANEISRAVETDLRALYINKKSKGLEK